MDDRSDADADAGGVWRLVAAGLVPVLLIAGCGDSSKPDKTGAGDTTTTAEPTLVTAPDSERVDLEPPTFSHPTEITNPLFPVTEITQFIQDGEEAGAKLHFEVTPLPETKVIEWDGQAVETVQSQFVAYQDGRILEAAVDFFAQADDGSVWYFGEDVANYEDGEIANTDGTWLAGKDGPPGMIMPADPQVGDVYRPENIPDFVFEEVTVQSTTETVDGPRGPIEGALLVEELLMDGIKEDKTFAPGYSEFMAHVEVEDELITLALAVPIDAVGGPVPAELSTISTGAATGLEQTAAGDWDAATTKVTELRAALETYTADDHPPLLVARLGYALDQLEGAVADRATADAGTASLLVTWAVLDLEVQHREVADVDADRLAQWAHQVTVDAEADEAAAVLGDVAVLETIAARVVHILGAQRDAVSAALVDLRTAADDGDLAAAADAADSLLSALGA